MNIRNAIKRMRFSWVACLVLLPVLIAVVAAVEIPVTKKINNKKPVSTKAYRGHANDVDQQNFVEQYPEITGTILDDCRVCHSGGVQNGRQLNSCDYCHAIYKKDGFTKSLNIYGKEYMEEGRSLEALKKLDSMDPDSDGFPSGKEIAAGSFPGEKNSVPNQSKVKSRRITLDDLSKLPTFDQLVLLNTHKHKDCYSVYSGWTLEALLRSLGTNFDTLTQVTVVSWDGFQKDFTKEMILRAFPQGIIREGMDTVEYLGTCPKWVEYPTEIPNGSVKGDRIVNPLRVMLAHKRNGELIPPLGRNENGKLKGEGPYRMILPQSNPSLPDQPEKSSHPDCPNPFDESLDHNSGDCPRGVIGIQVHPMPANSREPDWRTMADDLQKSSSILVFGNIQ